VTGVLATAKGARKPARSAVWVPTSVVARESITAGLLGCAIAALVAPADLGLDVAPHPIWAIVLMMGARYGTRGLVFALSSVWSGMALASAIGGIGIERLTEVWTSGANLGTGLVSLVIGWVASVHERRTTELAAKLSDLEKRNQEATAGVGQIRDAAVSLRARADRLDHSLAFLSDVATRLSSSDPVAAAEAALALARARCGARAGVVQIEEKGHLRTIAFNGAWSADMPVPPDVLRDRTVTGAWEGSKVLRGADLPDRGSGDSDVAAAICDEQGRRLGVIALRGVPADSLRPSGMRDLEHVAKWCGKSFAARGTAAVVTPPPAIAVEIASPAPEVAPSSNEGKSSSTAA
jgi:hypothetical protein